MTDEIKYSDDGTLRFPQESELTFNHNSDEALFPSGARSEPYWTCKICSKEIKEKSLISTICLSCYEFIMGNESSISGIIKS